MQRRIYSLLQNWKELQPQQMNQLEDYLHAKYFFSFGSDVNITALLPHIRSAEYDTPCALYEQGEIIRSYFFLLNGKVFLERRAGRTVIESDCRLLEGECVVGQFFYDQHPKRQYRAMLQVDQGPCQLMWIDKKMYHHLCRVQIEEYKYLKHHLIDFSDLTAQTLENSGLYSGMRSKCYRIGDQLKVDQEQRCILVIIQGECLVVRQNNCNCEGRDTNQCLCQNGQKMVKICKFDCAYLEQYFHHRQKSMQLPCDQMFKYKASTSEVKVMALTFDFIDQLPPHFISKLAFINDCHTYSLTNKPHINSNNALALPRLPRVERSSLKPTLLESSNNLLLKCQERRSHISRRSQSIGEFGKQNVDSAMIANFRRQFCLGYSRKFDKKGESQQKNKANQVTGEPKGYFTLHKSLDRQNAKENYILEQQHKDLSNYIELKSSSRINTIEKNMLITEIVSSKAKRLQSIFKKYEDKSNPSQQRQPRNTKINKKHRIKNIIFPINR